MPMDLDSPLVTLGALFIAGNDETGRQYTGGETGKGLLAGGFGSASAQWGGNQLQNYVGEESMTDELAQAVVGGALSKWGDPIPQNNAMARGILYNVARQGVEDSGMSAGEIIGDIGLPDGGDDGSDDDTSGAMVGQPAGDSVQQNGHNGQRGTVF